MIAKQPPDMVLLDVRMDGISGLETLRRIRALDLPQLPAAGPVGITLRAGIAPRHDIAELMRALRASV